MSHDLRTPLTAVLGLADLAIADVQGRTHLERLRLAAGRLQVQIEERLDLATLDADSLVGEMEARSNARPPGLDAQEISMRPSLWDTPSAEAGTGQGEVIEHSLLQRLTDGDEELMLELAHLMSKEIPLHRVRLVDAVQAGELEAVVRAAHALRGAAGNVAGVQVRACAGRMEEAARAGLIEAARQELSPLLLELERLSEALVLLRARGS